MLTEAKGITTESTVALRHPDSGAPVTPEAIAEELNQLEREVAAYDYLLEKTSSRRREAKKALEQGSVSAEAEILQAEREIKSIRRDRAAAREAMRRMPRIEELARDRIRRVRVTDEVFVDFDEQDYLGRAARQSASPVELLEFGDRVLWWFRDRYWWDSDGLAAEDVEALVLYRERRKSGELERARMLMRAQEAADDRPRRKPIPESVRHEVWRRDEGRCVACGSRERLEFHHIVPVSKGGSNTARNLELRCASCHDAAGLHL